MALNEWDADALEHKVRAVRSAKQLLAKLHKQSIPANLSSDETEIIISGFQLIGSEHEATY